jgi:hypothetical protein
MDSSFKYKTAYTVQIPYSTDKKEVPGTWQLVEKIGSQHWFFPLILFYDQGFPMKLDYYEDKMFHAGAVFDKP